MTDCPNAEIRDRLPDLLHERLDASTRAMVELHVAGCADCRAELELLRAVQSSLIAHTPRVDVSTIVAALPKPPKVAPMPAPIALASRRPRIWMDWRVAAAITVLAVGAGSYGLVQHIGGIPVGPAAVRDPIASVSPIPNPSTLPNASTPTAGLETKKATDQTAAAAVPPSNEVVAAVDEPVDAAEPGRLSNLSKTQLKALLDDIDRMPALPLTDAEPAVIKVDVKTSPSGPAASPEGM